MTIAHSREKVLEAFEMKEAGLGDNQIRRVLRVGKGTVQRWFSEPKLNPYLDDIAIERAIGGDVKVYDALTYFEREVVLQALLSKLEDIDFAARFEADAHRVQKSVYDLRDRDQARVRRARPPRPKGVTIKRRSPEFDAQVTRLYQAGKPAPDIAREVGASVTTVRRVLKDAA